MFNLESKSYKSDLNSQGNQIAKLERENHDERKNDKLLRNLINLLFK